MKYNVIRSVFAVLLFVLPYSSLKAETSFGYFPAYTGDYIAFDQNGYLWSGETNLIRKYELNKVFEVTGYNASYDLFDGHVTSICPVSDGSVWFGTSIGIYRYVNDTWSKISGQPYKINKDFSLDLGVWEIKEGPDGRMWVGTSAGIGVYDGSSWETIIPPIKNYPDFIPTIGSISFGLDGSVWIITNAEGIYHYINETWEVFTEGDGLYSQFLEKVFTAPDGTIWCTSKTSVSYFKNNTWYGLKEELSTKYPYTTSFAFDEKGNTWIAAKGSIDVFDGQTIINTYSADNLLSNAPLRVFNGPDDEIWIQTVKWNGPKLPYLLIYDPTDPPPVLTGPEDESYFAEGSDITITWEPSPGADSYEILISEYGVFYMPETYQTDETSFTFTAPAGYTYTSPLRWSVRAIRGDKKSHMSIPRKISTSLDPTALSAPANMEFIEPGSNLSFTWYAVPHATAYEIEFADNADFIDSRTYTVSGPSYSQYIDTMITKDYPMHWRVRSLNGDARSPWSEVRKFYTLEERSWIPLSQQIRIWDSDYHNGYIWYCTNRGVMRYDTHSGSFDTWGKDYGITGNTLSSVAIGGDGIVRIGSTTGLYRFENEALTYENDIFRGEHIIDIAVNNDGGVCAVGDSTLYILNGNEWNFYTLPETEKPTSLSFAHNGEIWVGINGLIYSFKEGNWNLITSRPNLSFSSIERADGGIMWAGSSITSTVLKYEND